MPNWFSRHSESDSDSDGSGSSVLRELAIAVLALAFGLVGMPFLIWGAGRATLGDYAHGGPLSLLGDYFGGLAQGASAFWVVALGPYALLSFLRFILRVARG